MSTRIRRASGAFSLVALMFSACYDELHIDGDLPTGYAWVRVYVPDQDTHRIYRSSPPTDAVSWRGPNLGEGIPVGGDLVAIIDSLRGFEVFTQAAPPDAGTVLETYVNVAGITTLEVRSPFTIAVDNLGDTVLLDIRDLPAVRELERLEAEVPIAPDPNTPPGPTDFESAEWPPQISSSYFECPEVERTGRFLGWRLMDADAKMLPLCTRD